MASSYVGQIIIFAGNFAPRGYALCNGQLLSIAQNAALFALIGTTYGGDGHQTFALPDLRGRVPLHSGQGTGLSDYGLGFTGGAETVDLTVTELPSHSHTLQAMTSTGTTADPANQLLASPNEVAKFKRLYAATGTQVAMSPSSIAGTGGVEAHNNLQPYLTLTFCIALTGFFPTRS